MADHAKALADALMETLVLLRKNAFDQDHRTTDKAQDIVLKALRAYDAHLAEAVTDTRPDCSSFPIVVKPAEAATRENGDLIDACVEAAKATGQFYATDDRWRPVVKAVLAALSTHQQQGECDECGQSKPIAELKLIDCPTGDCSEHVCFKCLYSRAPQPDTVTDGKK